MVSFLGADGIAACPFSVQTGHTLYLPSPSSLCLYGLGGLWQAELLISTLD